MPGESQQTPDSVPDPTVLVTEAIALSTQHQKEMRHAELVALHTRLDAMDKATDVLHETVTRTPTDIQKATRHLEELINVRFDLTGVKFASVDLQFKERDERAGRESRDNKIAVDAAFAAQEKLAVQQNQSNQTAIEKSEKTTNELIRQNAEAGKSAASAQADQIADLKERLARIEANKLGGVEQRNEARQAAGMSSALVFGVFGIIGVLAAIAAIVLAVNQGGP